MSPSEFRASLERRDGSLLQVRHVAIEEDDHLSVILHPPVQR